MITQDPVKIKQNLPKQSDKGNIVPLDESKRVPKSVAEMNKMNAAAQIAAYREIEQKFRPVIIGESLKFVYIEDGIDSLESKAVIISKMTAEIWAAHYSVDYWTLKNQEYVLKNRPVFSAWAKSLKGAHRARVHSVDFRPDIADKLYKDPQDDEMKINLYRGHGMKRPFKPVKITPIMNFMRDLLGGDMPDVMHYLAYCIQNPGERTNVSLCLYSEEHGTGKTFLMTALCSLSKHHSAVVTNPKYVVGEYNEDARAKCFIGIDDVGKIKPAQLDDLKTLIGCSVFSTNEKHGTMLTMSNFANVIVTTNNLNFINIERSDRRFMILNVSSKHVRDGHFFKGLKEWWDKGGREAFFWHLMDMQLPKDYLPKVKQTAVVHEAKTEALMSNDSMLQYWDHILGTNRPVPTASGDMELSNNGTIDVNTTEIYHKGYLAWYQEHNIRCPKYTPKKFADTMSLIFFNRDKRPRKNGIRLRRLPPRPFMRAMMDAYMHNKKKLLNNLKGVSFTCGPQDIEQLLNDAHTY